MGRNSSLTEWSKEAKTYTRRNRYIVQGSGGWQGWPWRAGPDTGHTASTQPPWSRAAGPSLALRHCSARNTCQLLKTRFVSQLLP